MGLITSRTQADVLARNEKGVYRAEDLLCLQIKERFHEHALCVGKV